MAKPKKPELNPNQADSQGNRNEKLVVGLNQPNPPAPVRQELEAAGSVRDFIVKMGAQVEPALYTLICDRRHPMRANIDKALAGGVQAAMIAIAPQLVSEYKFSLMMAMSVAAFAGQQVTAKGQNALCAELTAHRTQTSSASSAGQSTSAASSFTEPVRESIPVDDEPEEKPVKKKPKSKPANKPKPKSTKPKVGKKGK